MKTKIALTLLILLLSACFIFGQQIIYGTPNQAEESPCKSDSICETCTISPYKFNDAVPNTFITGNKTLVVCRLRSNDCETHVVCSALAPDPGWGSMIPDENDTYFYQEKQYGRGSAIYSIAFTDPKNGWAVGLLHSYPLNHGVIFHTKDGGKIWELQYKSGTMMELKNVGFSDAMNGWANGVRIIGDVMFSVTLYTSNGGETWEEMELTRLRFDYANSTPDSETPADY